MKKESNMELFNTTALKSSRLITHHYSTSFTLGIQTLHSRFHLPVYGIYGFVRYADEIVDTFHAYDKKKLLDDFRSDTYKALDEKISLNPVLHAFQLVCNEYLIGRDLIDAFLHSMEMDLTPQTYKTENYHEYIYGSAEVVGLMCLKIFCEGDEEQYERLKPPAKRLGAAFQKVNFLRDMQNDYENLGRLYFPDIEWSTFQGEGKAKIEADIADDFREALIGIRELPKGARMGVYLAYTYYIQLFRKIQRATALEIMSKRLRIPNGAKFLLLIKTYLRHHLNVIA